MTEHDLNEACKELVLKDEDAINRKYNLEKPLGRDYVEKEVGCLDT